MDFYQGTPNLPMTGGDIFTDITNDIATLNNTVVFKAGTQTITGNKTLSGTTTITGSVVANSLTITPTELGYIDGLTSNAQTQLNDKVSVTLPETISGSKTFSGTTTFTNNIVANALTITPTELGYIDGLTSNAQTQLNDKVSVTLPETISGSKTFSGTTTFTNNIVANALTITPTELGYIDGLTSNAQTQLNDKVSVTGTETISGSKTFSGTTTFTNNIVANALTITPTELGYIDGLTSNAQTQLNAKVSLTGAETIAGIKTFSSLPESSVVPTTSNQLTNKTYVDAAIVGAGGVTLAGTQTITGDKTFSGTTTFTGSVVANSLTITPTELGYIDGLTSNAQTQITARALDSAVVHLAGTETITGNKTFSGTTTITGDVVANALTITPTELGYIDGLTSNAQTQITARALDSAVVHLAGTETVTGTKTFNASTTFATGIVVSTVNRTTNIDNTGIRTIHPVSGSSFEVNSSAATSTNTTNTLNAGTVNNIANIGLAVGSAAVANSINTTGGYNSITSGTTSTLANEITATGGGGNSITTLLGGTTAVRSLGTGTALFTTNSGKNTLGSTSGQVELSTNNSGSTGILIQNTNTTTGGIRIENDGATGSLVLDGGAGTLNANTSTGKNSLSSTSGLIELITGSTSATGINIENTSATTGGIRIKASGATGDINIQSVDNINLTSSGAGGDIILTSASTAAGAVKLTNSSTGGISLETNRNAVDGISIVNNVGGVKILAGKSTPGITFGDPSGNFATMDEFGTGAVAYYVGAAGAATYPVVYPLYWFSTATGGQTTSQCRVGSFANNDTGENFIRYRLPFRSRVVGMTLISDQETVNAAGTFIHMSVTNTTGLDTTPAYAYWIYNAGAAADNIVVSSTFLGSVTSVAEIPAATTFYVFLAYGSTGTNINVVGTARTVPSEFQVHLYLQQVA